MAQIFVGPVGVFKQLIRLALFLVVPSAICHADVKFDPKPYVLDQDKSAPVLCRYSVDGKICVVCHETSFRVIRLADGSVLGHRTNTTSRIRNAAFCNDQVVVSLTDGTVHAWQALTGEELKKPIQVRSPVRAAAMTVDASQLILGCEDGSIVEVDPRAWRQTGKVVHQASPIDVIAISVTAKKILAANYGQRGVVSVWDTSLGQLQCTVQPAGGIKCASIAEDGRRILIADDECVTSVWNLSSQRICKTSKVFGHVNAIGFNRKGTQFYVAFDTGLKIFDAVSAAVATIELGDKISPMYSAQFSPDGRYIFGVGEAGYAALWSTASGASAFGIVGCRVYTTCEFSPDGHTIAVGCPDNHAIGLWRIPGPPNGLE